MPENEYAEFLRTKAIAQPTMGIDPAEPNPILFEFQKDIVKWSLRLGRAAVFADCGMGKTFIQLEWAKQIPGNVLILAPLAVAQQTIREGEKLGLEVTYCRDQDQVMPGITITNYDILDHFDPDYYSGIVLDESSIIKHFDGKLRNQIIDSFQNTHFRLACTATPAPNDYMELGNHAEFLGSMTRTEMLSMFFIHDGGDTAKWRLKGHANEDFWKWICSWAVNIRKPSDLGYEDGDFVLPPISVKQVAVEAKNNGVFLFPLEAQTLQERIAARRDSLDDRVAKCAEMVNASKETWIVWCNLNSESDALERAISGAVQVSGSEDREVKTRKLLDFANGKIRVLVTKPKIAGHGMNWQLCHNVAFVGLSDSWEQYYQAVRRCWRFGQRHPVNVYIITSKTEGAIVANIKRKEADAERLAAGMVKHMSALNRTNLKGLKRTVDNYSENIAEGKNWKLYLGDCVESLRNVSSDSVGFSVFSPPFASLYTYSASSRDMGNSKDEAEFLKHFGFLVQELGRVVMPGREVAVHCFDIPSMKERDGVIGIKDFSNTIRLEFERAGFVYHSRVTIWKDPVTQMQRTKALGLLHKQIKKDSSMSRVGLPDYLIVMRKLGENPQPITHTAEEFPVELWQKWASPVWDDIDPSDTLQYRAAREKSDERHICPLQLEVIRRALLLWSNPGDLVLSPFAGIGSEGYVALKNGRRFVGVELKKSYFDLATSNLRAAEGETAADLFSHA
jgi:DNA modification methylase